MLSILSIRKPSRRRLARFFKRQTGEPFSYQELGMTASPRMGWRVARYRGLLGHGQDDFDRAVAAVRQWRMFHDSIAELPTPLAPIESGAIVTPMLRAMGLWVLAACRIVYVVDEREPGTTETAARFGFAYGTLRAHPECGEERFLVEWRRDDDTIWYELTAVSRHRGWFSRLAHPVVRWAQHRFARLSVVSMQEAVAESRARDGVEKSSAI